MCVCVFGWWRGWGLSLTIVKSLSFFDFRRGKKKDDEGRKNRANGSMCCWRELVSRFGGDSHSPVSIVRNKCHNNLKLAKLFRKDEWKKTKEKSARKRCIALLLSASTFWDFLMRTPSHALDAFHQLAQTRPHPTLVRHFELIIILRAAAAQARRTQINESRQSVKRQNATREKKVLTRPFTCNFQVGIMCRLFDRFTYAKYYLTKESRDERHRSDLLLVTGNEGWKGGVFF